MKPLMDFEFFKGRRIRRIIIDPEQICIIEECENRNCIITLDGGREIKVRETMDEVERRICLIAELQYETERNREEKR